MIVDPQRMECTLTNDARLIAGFGAIVSDAADRAGLAGEEQENFAAAVMEACREAFAQLKQQGLSDSALHITVAAFPGRVEAAIEYAAPAAVSGRRESACQCSVDRAAAPPPNLAQAASPQYETRDGHCRVTLFKNCGEAKARTKN